MNLEEYYKFLDEHEYELLLSRGLKSQHIPRFPIDTSRLDKLIDESLSDTGGNMSIHDLRTL